MKRRDLFLDIAISLLILLGVWGLRAHSCNTFVTWDEPAWVFRSVKFLMALSRGDWAGTLLVGHPGVMTMWSGALSLAWHTFATKTVAMAQLSAIDALPALEVHSAETIRQLTALLPAAKGGILFLHAAISVMLYWLLKRLLDRRYALLAILLLSLDPLYLALSRVLHTDALASGFMLISILSALAYVRFAKRRDLICSGVAAGLAVLTKSYGLFVAPAVVLFLAGSAYRAALGKKAEGEVATQRPLWQGPLRDIALWGGAALGVFILLWPATWASPLAVWNNLVGLSLEYAIKPGDATASFFRGQATGDVGASFYPTVLFFRSTPLVLFGSALAIIGLLWRTNKDKARGKRRPVTLAMLVYPLLYIGMITLGKKKFDRYALPALLSADILAAIGLVEALDLIVHLMGLGDARAKARHVIVGGIAAILILCQGAVALYPLRPAYYLAYYNPLAGGLGKAVKTIPVGWGEGVERAAQYLANKPDAQEITVATWALAGIVPGFPGRVIAPTPENLPQADYVLLYVGDIQASNNLAERFYGLCEPEFVVEVNHVEYAWLYPNAYYGQLAQEIGAAAGPHDAILSNIPSAFQRHYQGDLAWHVIEGNNEPAVADDLQRSTQGSEHLFYIDYDIDAPRCELIKRQLAQNAFLIWEKPFDYGTLSYYALPKEPYFHQADAHHATNVSFDHRLGLQGYGLASTQVEYRQELGLGLRWQALQPLDVDYHIFMHLVDEQGQKWGQRDAPLRNADSMGTSTWPQGASYLCNYAVPLDAGIPPAPYWVQIGVYNIEDLSRLEIIGPDGKPLGTEFRIGPIDVVTPRLPPSIEDLAIEQPVELTFGDKAQIIGYALSTEKPESGDEVIVTLFWRCLDEMDLAYDLGLRLRREGTTIDLKRSAPAGVYHPTNKWVPGEILRYAYALSIPADAASGTYELCLNLYPDKSDDPLLSDDLLLAQIAVTYRQRLFAIPEIGFPARVTLGDGIEFLGYDLEEAHARPGGTLHFTLYWRALQPSANSYKVFTHLLDGQSNIRGQCDGVPVMGERPTTGWTAGEVIVDSYELSIDGDAPAGLYQIAIGMYDPNTGERLSMTYEDGRAVEERRILFEQTVDIKG